LFITGVNNTLADYFQTKKNMCDETAATSILLNEEEDLALSPEENEPEQLI